MDNVVYWQHYGCQTMVEGSSSWQWVKPCPAHAVCSWIKRLDTDEQESFCGQDDRFRKPV